MQRAVDAEQRRRPGDPAAVQQVADGDERRVGADPLLASEVYGQLRRLVQPGRERLHHLRRVSREGLDPLEGDEPAPLDLHQVVDQLGDPVALVDRDRDDGEILRERQQPIGPQPVGQAEAFDPP